MAVARPSWPVVSRSEDRPPTSTGSCPLLVSHTASSLRDTLAFGDPVSLRAVTVITACDEPSRVRRSGTTLVVSDNPSSDGPTSEGAF